MKAFFIGLIGLLTLLHIQLKAQLSAEVVRCNSVYGINSLHNSGDRVAFAHVLEKHISDDIWISYDKKFDNEWESLFQNLPQGKYRVKYVEKTGTKGGCNYQEIITVSNSVDITICNENKGSNSPNIKLSPNPSNGTTVVSLSQTISGERMVLKISALSGEVIESWHVVNEVFSIALYEIPAGVYFVELTSNGKRIAVERLVVN